MKIGNLDLGTKLFVAPMAEVTDSSFRKIAKEHGAGLTFTQMISALGAVKNGFETLRHLSFHRSEKPIGVQILGNDPAILGEAVKEIIKFNPDLIDINCGCPVEKVVCHKMGAALLDDPVHMGKIIKKMTDASGGVPITLKVRLGKDRKKINVIEIAKTAEDNGASMITVHARTRADKYDSEPDWNWLKKVKEQVKIPVVGNGSLFTPQDVVKMLDETGCDSAMIARGALGNPFIFERFNNLIEKGIDTGIPSVETVNKVLHKHLKLLQAEYGEPLCLDKAKKNSIWYFRDYAGIDEFLNNVFSAKDCFKLLEIVDDHVEKNLNGYYKHSAPHEVNTRFKKKVLFWLAEENVLTLG
ncbi:MAG: tRNA dihydrouridine synthase DusB [Ignavibacteriales bacterium]|nr:tRNA dihydrouridine synthase DusB [Ignavibacteriales bacterium]